MKCCICGAVKNVGGYLDKIFQNMEKVGTLFEDYVIILYYDISTDVTLQKLKNYQIKNPKLKFYSNMKEISKYRTRRIANARNGCLQMIRKNYSDYEMFIMMDCDDVCSQDIKLNVLQTYLYRNDWDALSFNKSNYYDIWALSIRPYMLSYRHFEDALTPYKDYITTLLKNVPTNGLLKCASAFNGFAIYRMNKFIDCNYDGSFNLNLFKKEYIERNIKALNSKLKLGLIEDCEHRAFHIDAINKNNARIRISPEILF